MLFMLVHLQYLSLLIQELPGQKLMNGTKDKACHMYMPTNTTLFLLIAIKSYLVMMEGYF